MRIANRRARLSYGMFGPLLFVPEKGHQYTSAVFDLPEREPIWTANCEVGRWLPPCVRVDNQIGIMSDHDYLALVLDFEEQAYEIIEDRPTPVKAPAQQTIQRSVAV